MNSPLHYNNILGGENTMNFKLSTFTGGLDTSKIFISDVATEPAKPRKTLC